MLKYSLVKNLLTKNPNDFIVKAQPMGSYNKEAIITEMLRHGTLLTRTDIVAVLNGFEETILEIIDSGSTVNTPLFKTFFSISGVFNGPTDNFDSDRVIIKVNEQLTPGGIVELFRHNIKISGKSTDYGFVVRSRFGRSHQSTNHCTQQTFDAHSDDSRTGRRKRSVTDDDAV